MKSCIYFYAFRYALGRMTYAVKEVVEEIANNLSEIETSDLSLMLKEIDSAISEDHAGMGRRCVPRLGELNGMLLRCRVWNV